MKNVKRSLSKHIEYLHYIKLSDKGGIGVFIETVIVSILIGILRGGKFSRLSNLRFKNLWLFILALVIQWGIVLFGLNGNEFVLKHALELNILSYILLFIGLIINIRQRTFIVILLGMLMNVLVIFANGFRTPISIDGLILAGYSDLAEMTLSGKLAFYVPLDDTSKYGFLCKIITVPPPYFFPQVFSIGDAFISLGLFLFIQNVMVDENYEKAGMVRFNYRSRI